MGYNMTEWETGDVVTAEKINKMENGIFNNDSTKASGFIFDYDETNQDLSCAVGNLDEFKEALMYGAAMMIHGYYEDVAQVQHEYFMNVNYDIVFSNNTISPTSRLLGIDTAEVYVFESYEDGMLKFSYDQPT